MSSPSPNPLAPLADKQSHRGRGEHRPALAAVIAGALAILTLGAIAISAHSVEARFADALRTLEQRQQATDELRSLSTTLREAERAELSYLLHGTDDSWVRFEQASTELSRQIDSLRALAASNTDLRPYTEQIEARLSSEMSRMSHAMQQRRNFGADGVSDKESDGIESIVRLAAMAEKHVAAAGSAELTSQFIAARQGDLLTLATVLATLSASLAGILLFWRKSLRARRLAEATASEQDAWRATLDFNPLPVLIVGSDRRVVTCNAAYEKLSLFTRDELVSHHVNDLVVPNSLKLEAMQHVESTIAGENASLLTRRVRKDGSSFDVRILSAPLIIRGKPSGFLDVYLEPDSQRQVKLETSLRRAVAERDAALKENRLLTADLMSSINTPVQKLRASAWRLQTQEDAGASKALTAIQALGTAVSRLGELEQAEQGQLQLQFIEFDLRELLEKTQLPHSVQCAVPKRMIGDPRRLRQLIETFGSHPGTSLTVELESESAAQVCLYFSFNRRCAPDGTVKEDPLAKRLAMRILTLMGGRIWGALDSSVGLQFHAMFALPGRSAAVVVDQLHRHMEHARPRAVAHQF